MNVTYDSGRGDVVTFDSSFAQILVEHIMSYLNDDTTISIELKAPNDPWEKSCYHITWQKEPYRKKTNE